MHKVRAAIYLRVSAEEHREGEVRSYERQRSGSANGINGLVEQHKLDVVHEFIEEDGTSASRQSTNARPQWEAALAGLGYDYDVLLSEEISRASRKGIDDFQRIDKICRERDARFISSVIDTASNEWSLIGPLLFELAARETDQLSKRVKGGMSTIIAKGGWVGGKVPYLWNIHRTGDVNNPTFTLNEEVCSWFRIAAVKLLEGSSYKKIATYFNEQGFKNYKGEKWTQSGVYGAFRGPAMKGQRIFGGKVICGDDGKPIQYTPPVIDPALMSQLNALHIKKGSLNRSATRKGIPKPQSNAILLQVECGCGRPMFCTDGSVNKPNRRKFYRCEYCNPRNAIYREELEDLVALSAFNFVNQLEPESDHTTAVLSAMAERFTPGEQHRSKVASAELVEIKHRFSKLRRSYMLGEVDDEEWAEIQQVAKDRMWDLEAEVSLIPPPALSLNDLWDFEENGPIGEGSVWASMSTARKRVLLESVIEKVVVDVKDPAKSRLVASAPEGRVTIEFVQPQTKTEKAKKNNQLVEVS
jgi:DNA invertase Pin-like site-specific DNA recombinase